MANDRVSYATVRIESRTIAPEQLADLLTEAARHCADDALVYVEDFGRHDATEPDAALASSDYARLAAREPQGWRFFAADFPADEDVALYYVFDEQSGGSQCAGPFPTYEEAKREADRLNAAGRPRRL